MGRCVVISFDLSCLQHLRREGEARIGWVLSTYDESAFAEARALAPEFLFCDVERMPAAGTMLWPGVWNWAIYEIRDLATAQRCHASGADYVETMAVRDLMTAFRDARAAPRNPAA
jgi:hypothetical protein